MNTKFLLIAACLFGGGQCYAANNYSLPINGLKAEITANCDAVFIGESYPTLSDFAPVILERSAYEIEIQKPKNIAKSSRWLFLPSDLMPSYGDGVSQWDLDEGLQGEVNATWGGSLKLTATDYNLYSDLKSLSSYELRSFEVVKNPLYGLPAIGLQNMDNESQYTLNPNYPSYSVLLDDSAINKSVSLCLSQQEEHAFELKLSYWLKLIGAVLFAVVLLFLIKRLVTLTAAKSKTAYETASRKIEEKKVEDHRKRVASIAEEEAVRVAARKAVTEDPSDASEIQDLINKSIEKGDTETAQALLKILNRRGD